MTSTTNELRASLSKLSLSSQSSTTGPKRPPTYPLADSWEDEASEGEDEDSKPLQIPSKKKAIPTKPEVPDAPPPTPISPSLLSPVGSPPSSKDPERFVNTFGPGGSVAEQRGAGTASPSRGSSAGVRPEKTDAVAKRMIAGALGVRAPKRTEEQKAYDRASREREAKRREKEKEDAKRAEEERQKAIKAAWDD